MKFLQFLLFIAFVTLMPVFGAQDAVQDPVLQDPPSPHEETNIKIADACSATAGNGDL